MLTKIEKGIIDLPAYTLTAITVAAVLYLTLVPDPFQGAQPVVLFPGADKVVHAIMMAGVYLCLAIDHMRREPTVVQTVGSGLLDYICGSRGFRWSHRTRTGRYGHGARMRHGRLHSRHRRHHSRSRHFDAAPMASATD